MSPKWRPLGARLVCVNTCAEDLLFANNPAPDWMTLPYRLDPQVAGELGDGTVLDSRTHPPVVSQVDFVLDYPDADELIQSFPVFLVSERLGSLLQAARLSGFDLIRAKVRPSDHYRAVYGAAPHPHYTWMQITGTAGTADCWLSASLHVCVSERMMEILQAVGLSDCSVEELPP